MSTTTVPAQTTPWYLWLVAIVTILWNGAGAFTVMMAQWGSATLDAAEAAYYGAQPLWFVITTDVALIAPVAAAIALLLRSRMAVGLFALYLIAVALNNAYDLGAGTSLALSDSGWRTLTIIIVVIAVLQFIFAWAMRRRGVLR